MQASAENCIAAEDFVNIGLHTLRIQAEVTIKVTNYWANITSMRS